MAFSIRSFFGKNDGSGPDSVGAASTPAPSQQSGGDANTAQAPGANPFANANWLFKTAASGDSLGAPVNPGFNSPFAVTGTPSLAPLTVGDLLPLLPVEVAKNPALPAGQPLHLPAEVLDQALNSGNATIPLFEVYRVCPAMFQTPISPHDIRRVQLPPHKISSLLKGRGVHQGYENGSASPFAANPAQGAFTPAPVQAMTNPFGLPQANMPLARDPFLGPPPQQNAESPSLVSSPFSLAEPASVPAAPLGAAPSWQGGVESSTNPFAASPFAAQAPQQRAAPQGLPLQQVFAPSTFQPAAGGFGHQPPSGNPFITSQTTTASTVPPVPAAHPLPEPPAWQSQQPPHSSGPGAFTPPAPFNAIQAQPGAGGGDFVIPNPSSMEVKPKEQGGFYSPSPSQGSPFGVSSGHTGPVAPASGSPFQFGGPKPAEPSAPVGHQPGNWNPFAPATSSSTSATPQNQASPFTPVGDPSQPASPNGPAAPGGLWSAFAPVPPSATHAAPSPFGLGGGFQHPAEAGAPGAPAHTPPAPTETQNAWKPASTPLAIPGPFAALGSPFAMGAKPGEPIHPADSPPPTVPSWSAFAGAPPTSPPPASAFAPPGSPFSMSVGGPAEPSLPQQPLGGNAGASSPFSTGPAPTQGSPFAFFQPNPADTARSEAPNAPASQASPFSFANPAPPEISPATSASASAAWNALAGPPAVAPPASAFGGGSPFTPAGPSGAEGAKSDFGSPFASPFAPAAPANSSPAPQEPPTLWNAGGPGGAAPSPFFLNETPAVSQPNSAAETPPIFPALPASFVGASSFEASRPTNQPEPKKEEPTFPPAPEAGSVKKSFVFGSSDEEQSSGVSGQEPIAPPAFAALTAPSSPPAADPFERIKSWANGETSPHAANPDASSAEQIKLSLSAILRQCSPIESGVNAELIPAWIQVSLPMEPIRTQFANGRVWVKLSDVANGLEPSFRNLLGQANPNALVELPVNDVFHALTAASAAKAQAQLLTDTPAPVVAPEPQAEPEISQPSPVVLEAVAPNPEVSSMPLTDSPAFAAEPESFASSGGEWPSMPPHGMGSFIIEPEGTSDFSEDTQEEVGFAHKTLAHEASAEPEPADMAPITLPVIIPANPHTGASAIVSQGPVEPSPRFSATSPEYSPARITGKASKQQLLLRALLGRSEELDPRTVVRFTGTQPGVAAVVCVHNGHKVESYTSPSEKNGDRFVEQAPMLLRHLEPLVDLTGINGTETFCIKTDERQITFSVQGPTALCVLHDPHHMEQGLAEKITLISRELAQMLKDSPPFA